MPQQRGRPRKPAAPVPRKSPRLGSSQVTVDAILIAAELELQDDGELTTNRVAERAGVSIGTLYQYFPNKFALVRAVHERYTQRFNSIVQESIDGATSVGEAARLLMSKLDAFDPTSPLWRALWKLRTSAAMHEVIAAQHRWMIELMARALERFSVATGAHARALAFLLVHGTDGIVNAVSLDPSADVGAIRETFGRLAELFSGSTRKR